MQITDVPNDVFIHHIFSQPELMARDVANCERVCKSWKNLLTDPLTYPKDALEVKQARQEYINARYEIDATKQKIRNKSWFGRWVFKINKSSSPLVIKIREILYRIVFFYRNEVNYQKDLEAKITNLQNSLEDLKLSYYKKYLKDLIKHDEEPIFDVFGGRSEYEKLPVLDISHLDVHEEQYIDYLKYNMLSAPIMRGRGANGREFFTIRCIKKSYETLYELNFPETLEPVERVEYLCQTFFERRAGCGYWVAGGDHLIVGGFPASRTELGKSNLIYQRKLQKLIEDKKAPGIHYGTLYLA